MEAGGKSTEAVFHARAWPQYVGHAQIEAALLLLQWNGKDDWYPVAILAAEIAALRASGRAGMRSWPKIAALGDNLASLLINETFDLREPLESLSTYIQDQLSTPPTVSEITETHFEVKLLWMKAVDLVRSHNEEIQELTEILDHQGYLSGEDIHEWWREINTFEYA